ncbi:MAG: undecaprenyl-phosphate glucose phosphotransferase [Bacteroidota bacterium]
MAGLYSRIIKPIHFIGDILIINSSFLLSYYIIFDGFDKFVSNHYALLQLIANLAWVISITTVKAYKLYRVSTIITIINNVIRLLILYFVIIEVCNGVLNRFPSSRIMLFYFYGMVAIAIPLWRIMSIVSLRIYRKKGHNYRRVIILGENGTTKDIVEFFNIHHEYGYRLFKVFNFQEYNGNFNKYIESLRSFCFEKDIDEIYCSMSEFNLEQLNQIIDFSEKKPLRLKFLNNSAALNFKNFKIDFYDFIPIYIFRPIPLDEDFNKILKRVFDIFFSFFVSLFIFTWLFPIVAIFIKFNSKGPVFFKQKRSGLDNNDFECYKFRTMSVNNESDSIQAKTGDLRITKVGAFLRRTSLDELPQFFNVLWGNMSIVGPRPHMIKHTEQYSEIIDHYMRRHFIKPGISGLAQIKGYRGETTDPSLMERRVKMDIFYMENWSFLLDLKIVLMTVINIFKGERNAV